MDPVTVHRELDLDMSPDEAWHLVGASDGWATWLADDVSLDVAEGATGTVVDDGITREVRVDRVDPSREVAFTWWPDDEPGSASHVVITLVPSGTGGTAVRIAETLSLTVPRAAAQAHDAGIRWMLRSLLLCWARVPVGV